METSALRAAYARLLDAASRPDLDDPADGEWTADQLLAHLLIVDASLSAVALKIVTGTRPTFDNRISLAQHNLDRIVAEHPDRAALTERVRCQADVLCDIADRLSDSDCAVLVPTLLLSHGAVVVDRPLPLGTLLDGLAEDHGRCTPGSYWTCGRPLLTDVRALWQRTGTADQAARVGAPRGAVRRPGAGAARSARCRRCVWERA